MRRQVSSQVFWSFENGDTDVQGCSKVMNEALRRIEEILSGSCPMNIRALQYSLTVLRYDSVLTDWKTIQLLLIFWRGQYRIPEEVYLQWIHLEDEGPEIDTTPLGHGRIWSPQPSLADLNDAYSRKRIPERICPTMAFA